MRHLWKQLLGLERGVVVEDVTWDEVAAAVVANVRPRRASKRRCGRCGARAPFYDQGSGRRRWRVLDLGATRAFLEADAPRVSCRTHGPTVAQVPWARHGARHSRDFEDQLAWLAVHTSKTAACALMRVAWRTVRGVVGRVVEQARAATDPFEGLSRIGIDEISYTRGQRYLLVVVDHDTGRLVWAAPGHDRATLESFFDALGPERSGAIAYVSTDACHWINYLVAERCPSAVICMDPFHVVAWATHALDEVRRYVWNQARRAGLRAEATSVARARYALWKNAEDLNDRQRGGLAYIATLTGPLHRAYLLKEQLRAAMRLKGPEGLALLRSWLVWAWRRRIPAFVELAGKIRRHWEAIEATLTWGLSNGLVESVNTKLRLLMRMAFGVRDTEAIVALAYLDRGGYCPSLPGRAA